ncbi:hypothetical protein D9615_003284 [Tricholomella constricta]|uniref:Uncharacterized protein n=1 Tax=Tricholomella constricta TaxID=117010 RepID=A0A8H5M827_9AGAR|nr:hypothetical protein D9615_003284 [Tricholomella constricta]
MKAFFVFVSLFVALSAAAPTKEARFAEVLEDISFPTVYHDHNVAYQRNVADEKQVGQNMSVDISFSEYHGNDICLVDTTTSADADIEETQ